MVVVKPKTRTPAKDRKPLQCSPEALDLLAEICDAPEIGRSRFDVINRMITWFSNQKAYVQTAILGNVDQGMELEYARALEILANDLRRKVSGDPSMRIADHEDTAFRLKSAAKRPDKPHGSK